MESFLSILSEDSKESLGPDPRQTNDLNAELEGILGDLDDFHFGNINKRQPKKPLQSVTNVTNLNIHEKSCASNEDNVDEEERLKARQWAQAMRKTVKAWLEKSRRVHQALEQQQIADQDMYEAVIRNMKKKYEQVQEEHKQALQHFLQTESKLHNIVTQQQARIRELETRSPQEQAPNCDYRNEHSPEHVNAACQTPGVATPHPLQQQPARPVQPTSTHRRQKVRLDSGAELVVYSNGAQKESYPDGTVVVRYPNGDIETKTGEMMAYYYQSANVIQVVQPDGSTIWEFSNQQMERHWPDGRKVVRYPDGTLRKISPDGTSEAVDKDAVDDDGWLRGVSVTV